MNRCAFLSMDNLEAFECYDRLLFKPFNEIGWTVDTVSWRNQAVDWQYYDAVVVRSCWDYQQEPDRFLNVIHHISHSSTRLANSFDLIEWNINKSYLKKLKNNGLPVVPTIFRSNYLSEEIDDYYAKLSTNEIIIKPTVGASSNDTFWLKRKKKNKKNQHLEKVFTNQTFLVQPFINNILTEGEYSLFYFNSRYSHAILKKPRAGDFRVQEEHGGLLQSVEPERELLRLSEETLRTLPEEPLYARLDFVRNKSKFQLMEVELIEPSLYFNMDDNSTYHFAEAFKQWWLNN